MAPVPSTTGDVRSSSDHTFNAAGDAVTRAFDAGSDSNRLLIVSVSWHIGGAQTLGDSAVTYNGVAMTAAAATTSSGSGRKRTYTLVAPATGSNTLSVDPSAGVGDTPCIIDVYCYSGVNQSSPVDALVTSTGSDASGQLDSLLTATGATGDLIWVSHLAQGNGVASGAATNFTERTDNIIDSGTADIGSVSGDVAGAASINTSVAWTGPIAINYIGHSLNINDATPPVGPLLTDDETTTNVSGVSATSMTSDVSALYLVTATDRLTGTVVGRTTVKPQ